MKILLSSADFFPSNFGGGQVYVYRLAKELIRRGHDVIVLTNRRWGEGNQAYTIDRYNYENIAVICLLMNPEAITHVENYCVFGPLTLSILRGILMEYGPDIVHINGIKPTLTTLCNKLNIPHVVTVHHTGIICPAGALVKTDGSICNLSTNIKDCVPCCNFWRRPKWYTGGMLAKIPDFIYGPIGKRLNDSKRHSYIERGLIYSYLVEQSIETKKMLLKQAQHFVAPSRAMHDLLVRNGCDPKKITVIPHGIEPLEKLPLETFVGRAVRFGYVGRIDRLKGLHVILEALELLPDGKWCELHIFGEAQNPRDEEYYKKTLAHYQGRAKVIVHGLIPHDKLVDAFAKIDILVVPSLLPEAFGLVVQESFSAARPVTVFNSGALPELVRDGIDGFVVERNNNKALVETMQKFIDNPNLVHEMSQQVPRVKTMGEHVDEIENVYVRAVGQG
jgi:glycosyltransferase involved in cell wall biosynthesis